MRHHRRDQPGQRLDRLAPRPGQAGVARRYDLSVDFSIAGAGLAVQPDSSVTRIRLTANGSWTLRAQDPHRTVITSGRARAMDAINVIDNQYFAADLENEEAQRQLAEEIADQITLQLASYFRKRTIHAST